MNIAAQNDILITIQNDIDKLSYSKSFPKINYLEGDALYPLIKDIKEVDDLTLTKVATFAMLKEARNVQRPQNIKEILDSDQQDMDNMIIALKKTITLLEKNTSINDVLKPFATSQKRVRPKGCGVVTVMFILSMLRPNLIAFCCDKQWLAASKLKDAPSELKKTFKYTALQCSQFDTYIRHLQKTKYKDLNLLQISNVLWHMNNS